MTDDFFDKIGDKISKQKAAKEQSDQRADDNRDFVKSIMPQLRGIADDYVSKCQEKGINASVKSTDYSITFTLTYPKGEKRDLVGSSDYEHNGKLSFEEFYPNDDGRRYKSLPTSFYDADNWSDDIFEAKLKKTIEDFVFYADRHGGLV